MPDQKTKPTDVTPETCLSGLPDERKRAESERLCAIMSAATGEPPVMWGASMIGFGSYHYRYASGHEGDAPVVAFAPRARAFTLYLSNDISDFQDHLDRLGKYKTGKGCLYVTRLSDVDEQVPNELIRAVAAEVRRTHG